MGMYISAFSGEMGVRGASYELRVTGFVLNGIKIFISVRSENESSWIISVIK